MVGLRGQGLGQTTGTLPTFWQALLNLPQTQKDVQSIAKVSEQIQSPEMQKQISDVAAQIQSLSTTMLILNALGTAAMVGMFLLQLREARRR